MHICIYMIGHEYECAFARVDVNYVFITMYIIYVLSDYFLWYQGDFCFFFFFC